MNLGRQFCLFLLSFFLFQQTHAVKINIPSLVNKINAKKFPSYSLKRSAELTAINSWRGLVLASDFSTIPEEYKMSAIFVKLALDALDRKENPQDPAVQRVQRLVSQLRPFSLDPKMSKCTNIYFIDDKNFDNAFTTSCDVFMTRSLPEKLNDNELRAVIAHEMGHGSLGHFPLTYQKLFGRLGDNLLRLPIEEAFWLIHGQFHGYMGAVHEIYYESFNKGKNSFYNSTSFRPTLWQDRFFQWFDATMAGVSSGFEALMNKSLKEYGAGQDTVELEADVAATVMLKRMGYSGEDLISALMKLEGIKSEDDIKPLPSQNVHTPRQYPSLYYRIQAIRNTDLLLGHVVSQK